MLSEEHLSRPGLLLLGGFELRDGRGTTLRLGSRKARALLAHLVVKGAPQARARLAALLWEDADEELARSSLRQALSGLRRALDEVGAGAQSLAADSQTVALDVSAMDVDLVGFRQSLAAGTRTALEQASQLYRGELLDGLDMRAGGISGAFDDWLRGERLALHRLALGGLDRLAALSAEAGDAEAALVARRRYTALEPASEPAAREVMRLEMSRGRHAAALDEYRRVREVLRRDLELAPEPETEALHREILDRRRRPPSSGPTPTPGATPTLPSSTTAAEPEPRLTKQATVLAVRLAALGGAAVALDPEDAARITLELAVWVGEVTAALGGVTTGAVGTEVVVAFGADRARGNEQEAGVRAALALRAAVEHRPWSLPVRRSLGIGLAAGPLVEAAAHPSPMLVGAAVSRALELSALAAQSESTAILADSDLAQGLGPRLLAHPAPLGDSGVVLVSGLSIDGGGAPLVGRRAELAVMLAALERCRQGEGGVLVVRGEAGIGKSRLLAELVAAASGQQFRVAAGRAFDFGPAARSLVPALTLGLLGLPAELQVSARTGALASALAGLSLEPGERVALHELCEAALPEELVSLSTALDEDSRQRRRAEAFGQLLRHCSLSGPLVLVLEDAHWASTDELALLGQAAGVAGDAPVLLVVSTRVDGDPLGPIWRDSFRRTPLTTLDLGALSPRDARALAGHFPALDEKLIEACLGRAEGHPLFLEQLLRAAAAGRQELPGTVKAVVLARLEALSPEARETLLAAAVLGLRMSPAALAFVADRGSGEPLGLSALCESGLMRRESGTDEVGFAHALIRDAVYQSLLGSVRRRLHLRAASWFSHGQSRVRAEHLAAAEDSGAASAFIRASREEASAHRLESALTCATHARRLAQDPATVNEASTRVAEVSLALGRMSEALGAYREALEFATDDAGRAEAELGVAGALRILDRHDEALEVLAQAERRLTAGSTLARLWTLRGNIHFPRGDLQACLAAHEEARRQAVAAGSTLDELNALGGLGDAWYQRGRMRTAQRCFESCVQGARDQEDLGLLVAYLPMLGLTRLYDLRFPQALRECEEALELARQIARPRAELVTLVVTATVHDYHGQPAQALPVAEHALKLARQVGARRFEAETLGLIGVSLLALGRRSESLESLREAWSQAQQIGAEYCGPFLLGSLAMAASDPLERGRALEQGEALLERGSLAHNALDFHFRAMEACLQDGQWPRVRRHADALERATADEPLPWAELLVSRGRLLAAAGDRGEGGTLADAELAANVTAQLDRAGLSHLTPAMKRAVATARS